MKKIAIILAAIIAAASFAACAKSDKQAETAAPQTQTEKQTETQDEIQTAAESQSETESKNETETEAISTDSAELPIVGMWAYVPTEGTKTALKFTADGKLINMDYMYGTYEVEEDRVLISFTAFTGRDPRDPRGYTGYTFDGDRLVFDSPSELGTGFDRIAGESGDVVGVYRREDDGFSVFVTLGDDGSVVYSTVTDGTDTYTLDGNALTAIMRGQDGQRRTVEGEVEIFGDTLFLTLDGLKLTLTRSEED